MAEEVNNETKKEPRPGMWASLCLILWAIAENIKSAGPVEMSNMFRVLYRSFLGTIMVVGGGWFLWVAAFTHKSMMNEHTGVIVGFVTGTFISLAITFYFGGQDRQKKKEENSDVPNS